MEKEAAIVQLYTDDGSAAYPVINEHAIYDDEGKEIVSELKQQLNDSRDYIYDMDLQSAEAYVNSEYAVALTELEV